MSDLVINAEHGVIGCLLLDSQQIRFSGLAAGDFSQDDNRLVFSTISEMVAGGLVVDAITVAERIGRADITDLLVAISRSVLRSVSLAGYAAVVKRASDRRKVVGIAEALLQSGNQDDLGIPDAVKGLMGLERVSEDHDHDLLSIIRATVNDLEIAFETKGAIRGITTGVTQIDRKLGGLHPSDLVVVGARPAVGKTAFAINLAINAGVPVGFISAEQPALQIGQRIIAIRGEIEAAKMRSGDMDDRDWDKLSAAVGSLKRSTVRVYDKSAPRISEIAAKARQWQRDFGIKALYVDYIQRLKSDRPDAPRHEQVADIAAGLKELARDLNIPVVALSQINRMVEQGRDKRPTMSQLKDSGAIEQEADVIMLLYRDEVYNEESDRKGIMDISIEKNRHGQTGAVAIKWEGRYMKTSDLPSYDD